MTAPAIEYQTFSLEQVCELTGAPSYDWLYRRIVSGELTAVLAGRAWRMTHSDMAAVVTYMRNLAEQKVAEKTGVVPAAPEPSAAPTNAAGLSARSANRMRRRAKTP